MKHPQLPTSLPPKITTLIDTWVFFFRSARKRIWNRTSNYWVGNLNFQFARGWIAVIWARDRLGFRRLFKATPICLFFCFFFWFGFRERDEGGREKQFTIRSVPSRSDPNKKKEDFTLFTIKMGRPRLNLGKPTSKINLLGKRTPRLYKFQSSYFATRDYTGYKSNTLYP